VCVWGRWRNLLVLVAFVLNYAQLQQLQQQCCPWAHLQNFEVCGSVSVNNGFTHTPPHTHWYGHPYTRTVAFSVRVQWQTQCSKGGQSSSANCMRWECATAVSDHASIAHFRPYSSFLPPSPFYFLDFFAPLQPPLVSSKNCSLQMTNFTFSCLPSQKCECVCYLHLVFCSCSEFHFVTLSPPFKNCLYCLTRSHSKFSYTDCSSCSRKKE